MRPYTLEHVYFLWRRTVDGSLPLPKKTNRAVMLANIHVLPENCRRLYSKRYANLMLHLQVRHCSQNTHRTAANGVQFTETYRFRLYYCICQTAKTHRLHGPTLHVGLSQVSSQVQQGAHPLFNSEHARLALLWDIFRCPL